MYKDVSMRFTGELTVEKSNMDGEALDPEMEERAFEGLSVEATGVFYGNNIIFSITSIKLG